MVTWTERDDIRDKYRGYQKPRYSANEAPIKTGQDDRRSAYLRNSYIDNVNAAREQNAINNRNNNLDYAMSRSPDFYRNKDNLRSIKGVLESTPAVTTDQNESRNMYQMLMNQMKGGDKGARLIDTSGLPAGARRIGRTLFTDPAKSQGFLRDVGSFFTGKNEAAVRAPEYNPFPKAGFGKEFYKDEFGGFDIGGLMEGIFKLAPYTGAASKIASALGGNRDREPLERDPRFLPENNVFDINFDEVDNIPFMGDDFDISEEFVFPDMTTAPIGKVEETDLMAEALKEAERQALKDQIMVNNDLGNLPEGLDPTKVGDMYDFYGIKSNFFDPEAFYIEQEKKGIKPKVQTGIIESLKPSPLMQENEIIQKVIKENPFMLNIMGNDYQGIRAYLFDIGILDPDSDLFGQTSNLENVKPIEQFMTEMVDE